VAYNLKNADNVVLIETKRYSPNPMIIKGAGAGTEVTAAGVFGDILKISNF
jgi:aspartokinase/homoserine dehydrogenase 1